MRVEAFLKRSAMAALLMALVLLTGCSSSSFAGGDNQGTKEAAVDRAQSGEAKTADPDADGDLGHSSDRDATKPSDASKKPDAGTNPAKGANSKKPANNPTVVTRGSFSAWAEPPNPDIGEDYEIVIEIELPSGVSSYSLLDLSGLLVGTDGYHQTIGPRPERWVEGFEFMRLPVPPPPLEVAGGYARIRVPIPGALMPLTRDTVTVKSVLLKEEQTLAIQFQ